MTNINRTRFYQCGRKTLFVSEHAAKTRAGQITAEDGVKMRAYQCKFCGGWHLARVKARFKLR